jgi:hypothetical protein
VFIKPGLRLRSAVCSAEVIVVRAGDAELDLRCGGQPLLPFDSPSGSPGSPGASGSPGAAHGAGAAAGLDLGTLIGKRYGADGLEILCTKAGQGTLSVGDEPLPVLEPRRLPSSD